MASGRSSKVLPDRGCGERGAEPRITRSMARAAELALDDPEAPHGEGSDEGTSLGIAMKEAVVEGVQQALQAILPSMITEVIRVVKETTAIEENTKNNDNKNWHGKRVGRDSATLNTKVARMEGRRAASSGARTKKCGKCARGHLGECRLGTNGCYRCGKQGHVARECGMVRCYNCSGRGHVSRDCKKPRAESARPSR